MLDLDCPFSKFDVGTREFVLARTLPEFLALLREELPKGTVYPRITRDGRRKFERTGVGFFSADKVVYITVQDAYTSIAGKGWERHHPRLLREEMEKQIYSVIQDVRGPGEKRAWEEKESVA